MKRSYCLHNVIKGTIEQMTFTGTVTASKTWDTCEISF
jgi:hypothetical protein